MNIQIHKYSLGLTVQKSKGLNGIIKATQNIKLIHSTTIPRPGTEGFRTEEPSYDLWTHGTYSLEDKERKKLPHILITIAIIIIIVGCRHLGFI